MAAPRQPVTLSPEQIEELQRKLSTMRHDISNNLSVVVAALELIRYQPEAVERMLTSISQQPARIGETLAKFSVEFEKILGITRP
jgi:hypothetical protein